MSSFTKKMQCAVAVAVLVTLVSPRIVWAHGGSGSTMSGSHQSMAPHQTFQAKSSYSSSKMFKQSSPKMITAKSGSTSLAKNSKFMNKFSSSKVVSAPNGNTGVSGIGLPGKSSSSKMGCWPSGNCQYGCSPWFGGYGCGFGGYRCGFGGYGCGYGLFGCGYGYGCGYGSYGYPCYSSYYPYGCSTSILTPLSSVLPVSYAACDAAPPSDAPVAVDSPATDSTVLTASVPSDSAM